METACTLPSETFSIIGGDGKKPKIHTVKGSSFKKDESGKVFWENEKTGTLVRFEDGVQTSDRLKDFIDRLEPTAFPA